MDEFTEAEVLEALNEAATEASNQAAFLDDPNVIGDKRQVPLLDRRAQALIYAANFLQEKWGR